MISEGIVFRWPVTPVGTDRSSIRQVGPGYEFCVAAIGIVACARPETTWPRFRGAQAEEGGMSSTLRSTI